MAGAARGTGRAGMTPVTVAALAAAAAFALVPWHLFAPPPVAGSVAAAMPAQPALMLALLHGNWWLLPGAAAIAGCVAATLSDAPGLARARILTVLAALALLALFAQGLLLPRQQPGLGLGAIVTLAALVTLLGLALAEAGSFAADPFIASAVTWLAVLLGLFVFWPLLAVLVSAALDQTGAVAPDLFAERLLRGDIWGLSCVAGGGRCGVAFNTVWLGLLSGAGSTLLGLAFALVLHRSALPGRALLRVLGILPLITPPFVVSLAIVVLFGRTGIVTQLADLLFETGRSRWIYGLPGLLLAQLLSQTPIAFLILLGGLRAVSPTLEEAATTLRAGPWRTFATVTWPLLRPALANAFLISFVESVSDFGNPLVLGGEFEVLSTKIFFAVVGAQHDPGRAAVLALVLLAITLVAFALQYAWLGRGVFVSVTGKGDSGIPPALPRRVAWPALAVVLAWLALTVAVYGIILAGGFVRDIGRGDLTFTLRHFADGFAVEWLNGAPYFAGGAWPSLFTTLAVAAVSAPLTAALGVLAGYLFTRQRFAGRRSLEFMAMLSFAIPGTVVGVSYILAFNTPPLELAGTGTILVLCFIFRNMAVGLRATVAALAQLDRSLDEASLTLGAGTAGTLRRVILPLIRPALVVAMVYSFVTAMTAVSAVIFLVSARFPLATPYIVGLVEAGFYPYAIAYSSLLIVLMLAIVVAIQAAVGDSRLGRRLPDLARVGA